MSRTGLTIANSKKTHLHLTPKQRTFAEVYVANYPNITKKEALSWNDSKWKENLKKSALKRIKPWMWRRNINSISSDQ